MSTQPSLRNDLVDIIILSRRGAPAIQALLTEASQAPSAWIRHTFIVVFSNTQGDALEELASWYQRKREEMPLPNIVARQLPNHITDLNVLRQYALTLGRSPYVYFQDDDDPLPHGLDIRIDMMNIQTWDAVYGVTETFNARNHTVEAFPTVSPNGHYLYDPLEGSKWFPTFAHPLAALFRRSSLETVGIDDKKNYSLTGNAAFMARLLNSGCRVTFLPDIIRRVRHHDGNTTGLVIDEAARQKIANDIEAWQEYIKNPEVKDFQQQIAHGLRQGDISTFKEIDSMVENKLDDIEAGFAKPA